MEKKANFKLSQILIEVAVVTVGILIAFSLNSWKEARTTKNLEEKMLKEIRSNLELDLIDLQANFSGHEGALEHIRSLQAGPDNYPNNIGNAFGASFRDFIFSPQTSAFETLKARGVDLISNDSLRIQMLRLYAFDYVVIEKIEENYPPSQFTDHYHHIVLTYFDQLEKGDTDWIASTDVQMRLQLVQVERNFVSSIYETCIQDVNQLIDNIDKEIQNEF